MFKVGDRVVCITRLYKNDIIVGKQYEVHSVRYYDTGEYAKSIGIKNKNGIVSNYSSIQFVLLSEHRREKIEKLKGIIFSSLD